MKIENVLFGITLLFLLFTPTCISAAEETGGYGASYLRWGAGARANSLGQAYTALANQGNTIFWNPAGLPQNPGTSVAFMHSALFADRTLNTAEAGLALPILNIGIGWQGFGVSDIQERDEDGHLLGNFDNTEHLFAVGIGKRLFSAGIIRIHAGVAGKHFRHTLHNSNATGWGADVGVLATLSVPGVIQRASLGTVVQNIGAGLTWDTESGYSADIPTTFRIGGAFTPVILPFTAAIDLEKTGDTSLRTHFGLEYTWMILALRAGLNDGRFAAGLGLVLPVPTLRAQIDYTITTDEISDQPLHFINAGLQF